MDEFTGVGANTVIMPDNHIPEGTAIGALSLVPPHFEFSPWSIYAGIPIRYIKPRCRENVLAEVAKVEQFIKGRNKH